VRGEGAWLGASWLGRLRDEGFVFGAQLDGDALVVSAIGGKLDPGEGFLDAARREFREETGIVAPLPRDCARADLLGAELRDGEDTEGACVLIRKRPDTDLTDPPALWIAVFLGRLEEEPRPVEKLTAFLVVPPQAFDGLASGVAARQLGRVIGDPRAAEARRTVLRDTPKAVAECPGLLARLWPLASASDG
jgi:8-oxo-dGTP pyrophosphatase MutT (NUDIX family)